MPAPIEIFEKLAQFVSTAQPESTSVKPSAGFTPELLLRLKRVTAINPWERMSMYGAAVGVAAAVFAICLSLESSQIPADTEPSSIALYIVQSALEK